MKQARVIEERKTNYVISDNKKELLATVRGSFFTGKDFPKVGDIILYTELEDDKAIIDEITPRTSVVSRQSDDGRKTQVIVTNIDIMFVVMGLDKDFDIERLHKYLLLAGQNEVTPVIILSKSDIPENLDEYVDQVQDIAGEVPVHVISTIKDTNMDVFDTYILPDTISVLLGSSGAGKSTITNYLLNHNIQKTSNVRKKDSRGRHTTTSRQMFTLPNGGYLIDTPGMRELGKVDKTKDNEEAIFTKIDDISTQCKYRKCDHDKSDGCAIVASLATGDITEKDVEIYVKLRG